MKMPNQIDSSMIGVCGMNCAICYKHLSLRYPCHGCQSEDASLPHHCRKCHIKECAKSKQLSYCFSCPDTHCKKLLHLDNNYRRKYHISLIQNGIDMKQDGIDTFLQREKEKWTCPHCHGILSLHDQCCSECGNSSSHSH